MERGDGSGGPGCHGDRGLADGEEAQALASGSGRREGGGDGAGWIRAREGRVLEACGPVEVLWRLGRGRVVVAHVQSVVGFGAACWGLDGSN